MDQVGGETEREMEGQHDGSSGTRGHEQLVWQEACMGWNDLDQFTVNGLNLGI